MARVLIDNGSALNVCPLITVLKLGLDKSDRSPSSIVIRAFDGSARAVIGEVDLPVEIGPHTFEMTFQVLDVPTAYNFLLGRPGVHTAGAVPSSLHQSVKFIINDHLVTVYAEEDIMVQQSPKIPTIDIETFSRLLQHGGSHPHYVCSRGISSFSPQLSSHTLMVAKIMIENGFKPGTGIDAARQGKPEPITMKEVNYGYGLGYKPTQKDKERMIALRQARRLTQLEGRDPPMTLLKEIPHISVSFPKTAYVYQPALLAGNLTHSITESDETVYPPPKQPEVSFRSHFIAVALLFVCQRHRLF